MKKTILTSITGFIVLILIIILTIASIRVFGQKEEKYTKEELITMIDENQNIKQNAHTMAESARALGWKEDDKLIKELQDRWSDADEEEAKHKELLNNIIKKEEEEARKAEEARIAAELAEKKKWEKKENEYPAATTIWRYMKDLGWNDYVCAGILGNIMTEVGGQTLNINYASSSNSYYGMCQWNRAYSKIWGAGLISQCDFLRDTIKYEIDTYGKAYKKSFNFDSFLNLTDCRAAALAFAKSYERCGSGSYKVRQSNAVVAYNYFVD